MLAPEEGGQEPWAPRYVSPRRTPCSGPCASPRLPSRRASLPVPARPSCVTPSPPGLSAWPPCADSHLHCPKHTVTTVRGLMHFILLSSVFMIKVPGGGGWKKSERPKTIIKSTLRSVYTYVRLTQADSARPLPRERRLVRHELDVSSRSPASFRELSRRTDGADVP